MPIPEDANLRTLICGKGCVGLKRDHSSLECNCIDGYYDPNTLGKPDCKGILNLILNIYIFFIYIYEKIIFKNNKS